MTTVEQSLASEKQVNFITSLLESREVPENIVDVATTLPLKRKVASLVISEMLMCPKKPFGQGAAKNIKPVQEGYYLLNNEVHLVVTGKTGNRYAKKLVNPGHKPRWDYAPGVIKDLVDLTPLTLEEAAAFGHLNGYCLACGRNLTDPVSVQNGIGPVCAKKAQFA